jgi:hypothetical protein
VKAHLLGQLEMLRGVSKAQDKGEPPRRHITVIVPRGPGNAVFIAPLSVTSAE